MSPVTRNFQELVPFRVDQISLLENVFHYGDSDPRWSLGPGAENALRLQRSLEIFSSAWGLPRESLTLLPDRYLAFYLAITGAINATSPASISHSPIDKKEILAIVRGIPSTIERKEFKVGLDGTFDYSDVSTDLSIVQIRNGETGISQSDLPSGPIIIDATSALPGDLHSLDLNSTHWHAVVLDATSWGGPRGVYLLSINPASPWGNPLPTLDTSLPIFGASYGLTLLAALELERFSQVDQGAIAKANLQVREMVRQIPEVEIAGEGTRDRLSLSFLYVQSEELQRILYRDGFLFDSGSACSSSALSPSHVLTGMGLLSQGNVRLRFRPENIDQAGALGASLVEHVTKLRESL